MKQRIQKIIAASGYCSRRAAEVLLDEGRVRLNGAVCLLGDSAEAGDLIEIDGKPLTQTGERTYIMLNKPRGYVTTMSDEKGRKTVSDLVRGIDARVFPVGRLDMDSEGLLIMTDDGELANRLTHPSHRIEKTYILRVCGKDIAAAVKTLRLPLVIDGKAIRPAKVALKKQEPGQALLSITISEGRNRQIRKMCQVADLKVLMLRRVSVGPLRLEGVPAGKWRYLSPEELDKLQKI